MCGAYVDQEGVYIAAALHDIIFILLHYMYYCCNRASVVSPMKILEQRSNIFLVAAWVTFSQWM